MVRAGREEDCNMETSPGDVGAKLRVFLDSAAAAALLSA